MDPERAHRWVFAVARTIQGLGITGFLKDRFACPDARLEQSLWGLRFANPVGLAAGLDKNAVLLPCWEMLGFGFVEVGSVSAQPSPGNPRPRVFRLPEDEALVNRIGLKNRGAHAIAARLRKRARRRTIPVGVNIAKTHDPSIENHAAIEDFRRGFEQMAPVSDYVALNISCPNTREGKTFEHAGSLKRLLEVIMEQRARTAPTLPVLLKLSPPSSDRVVFDSLVEEIVDLAGRYGISGFVATNTASDREGLSTDAERLEAIGEGGFSGRPLESRSTTLVRYLYRRTGGSVPIIGVGGVFSAEDAYRKIRAGATLVQVYTGLVYRGPELVRDVNRGLLGLLERDGFDTIADAVGVDAGSRVDAVSGGASAWGNGVALGVDAGWGHGVELGTDAG